MTIVDILTNTTTDLSGDAFDTVARELYRRRSLDLRSMSVDEQYERIIASVSHTITPERLKELLGTWYTNAGEVWYRPDRI